ncbi:MAG: Oxidoreductase, short-chain dehydrogenase/reductase family [uncultured bacterium]|nr:MAG: Oxidoreductase, short-chain dehydrogenase/reductase family [uncultured bacterium]
MLNTMKVALITGSGRRIGAEIASKLHAAGINVALHYHQSRVEAERLCHQFNEQRPHSAILLQADLTDISCLEELVKQAVNVWGRLDVLINNAARFYKTKIGQVTESSWDDLLNSNLKAPFFLSQAAADYLRMQQGCIVNIADVHAKRPMRDYGVYSISKAGLVMLTKMLAKELGPSVRVNAVSPGTVMLPEGENTLSESVTEKIINRIALHRYGTPVDIAKAVLFLVQEADYMTGEIMVVDGGRSLSM